MNVPIDSVIKEQSLLDWCKRHATKERSAQGASGGMERGGKSDDDWTRRVWRRKQHGTWSVEVRCRKGGKQVGESENGSVSYMEREYLGHGIKLDAESKFISGGCAGNEACFIGGGEADGVVAEIVRRRDTKIEGSATNGREVNVEHDGAAGDSPGKEHHASGK